MRYLILAGLLVLAGCVARGYDPAQAHEAEVRSHCSQIFLTMAHGSPTPYYYGRLGQPGGFVLPVEGFGDGYMQVQRAKIAERECLWRHGVR